MDLYWRDNPTCNGEWFKYQCGKLDNDPVAIARELERDPSASIKGRVWPNLDDKKHFISLAEANKRWDGMQRKNGWVIHIGSDNGGFRNKSSQNYSLIHVHVPTSTVFIEDTFFIDNTSVPGDVMNWALKMNFDLATGTIYGDQAIKANHTFNHHSTAYLLRQEGFHVIEVANRDIAVIHRDVRKRIDNGEFFANSGSERLTDSLKLYRYEEDGSVNKKDADGGDAISYFFRCFFHSSTLKVHKY